MSRSAPWLTAATKDTSFPGGFGQISSYVTRVRLVTPQGELREITARQEHPEVMRLHPLVLRAVRHRLRGDDQGSPDDRALGAALLVEPRNIPALFPHLPGARLRRDVLHLSICAPGDRRAAQGQSGRQPKSRFRWNYRNRFWRKYWAARSSVGSGRLVRKRENARPPRAGCNFFLLGQADRLVCGCDDLAARQTSTSARSGARMDMSSPCRRSGARLLRHRSRLLRFLHADRGRQDRVSLRICRASAMPSPGSRGAAVL